MCTRVGALGRQRSAAAAFACVCGSVACFVYGEQLRLSGDAWCSFELYMLSLVSSAHEARERPGQWSASRANMCEAH